MLQLVLHLAKTDFSTIFVETTPHSAYFMAVGQMITTLCKIGEKNLGQHSISTCPPMKKSNKRKTLWKSLLAMLSRSKESRW